MIDNPLPDQVMQEMKILSQKLILLMTLWKREALAVSSNFMQKK